MTLTYGVMLVSGDEATEVATYSPDDGDDYRSEADRCARRESRGGRTVEVWRETATGPSVEAVYCDGVRLVTAPLSDDDRRFFQPIAEALDRLDDLRVRLAEVLDRLPTPCPRCHGRGTVSEDPAPDCPSVAYPAEECAACEGTGERLE